MIDIDNLSKEELAQHYDDLVALAAKKSLVKFAIYLSIVFLVVATNLLGNYFIPSTYPYVSKHLYILGAAFILSIVPLPLYLRNEMSLKDINDDIRRLKVLLQESQDVG